MPRDHSAAEYLPDRISLTTLRDAVQRCRGCDLYKEATQAIFGEGLKRSHIMMVGEQPGDQEDRHGKPFIGPAGAELNRSLDEAGIDRDEVFVTNAVKHFKWEPRGKRRLHKKPSSKELAACRPWLEAELSVVMPTFLVALGATAAKALYGNDFRVTKQRGKLFETQWAPKCMGTLHPSSILRSPDSQSRRAAREAFVEDLRVLAEAMAAS